MGRVEKRNGTPRSEPSGGEIGQAFAVARSRRRVLVSWGRLARMAADLKWRARKRVGKPTDWQTRRVRGHMCKISKGQSANERRNLRLGSSTGEWREGNGFDWRVDVGSVEKKGRHGADTIDTKGVAQGWHQSPRRGHAPMRGFKKCASTTKRKPGWTMKCRAPGACSLCLPPRTVLRATIEPLLN